MAYNKIYFPADAINNHEEFEGWYEDGSLFMTAKSDYASEKSRLYIYSRLGAEMACIKPDYKVLRYDVRVERYTYELCPFLIENHYHAKGMLWQMYGSPSKGHANFINENTKKKDVLITTCPDFKGHGPCFEVKVKDISKLRPAVAFVLAILWKEHWKGLSIGELPEKLGLINSIRSSVAERGLTYEEVMAGKTNPYE